jgi:hypothetical protein
MKRCFRCGVEKPIDEFIVNKGHKDGHGSYCKPCDKERQKEYRIANADKLKECRKIWCEKNKEYVREKAKQYQKNNLDKFAKYRKKYYENNKDKIARKHKEYADAHKDEARARATKWRINNRERVREAQRKHDQKVRSTPMGRISENISSEISRSITRGIRGKRGHWEDIVGYTKEELKNHLESQFDENMSWNNYGSYWHIDHIVPMVAFNFETPEDIDFKRCWSLSNLRPLEATENMKKRCKIIEPFQPALAIAV